LKKCERPGKKLEPWPKTGSATDASREAYAPGGAKRKKSSQLSADSTSARTKHSTTKSQQKKNNIINEAREEVGTDFADKWRSLGRYSSLADSSYSVKK
jgi:hypothetical protein